MPVTLIDLRHGKAVPGKVLRLCTAGPELGRLRSDLDCRAGQTQKADSLNSLSAPASIISAAIPRQWLQLGPDAKDLSSLIKQSHATLQAHEVTPT